VNRAQNAHLKKNVFRYIFNNDRTLHNAQGIDLIHSSIHLDFNSFRAYLEPIDLAGSHMSAINSLNADASRV
jgi:hypothetical protein